MKRHTQATGVRNWYGDDLVELQAEGLKALDAFFSEYGNYVISGCAVTQNGNFYDVAPGIVSLSGKGPDGEDVKIVAPFEGVASVALPIYLTLDCETISDTYVDGSNRPVAYSYKAVATSVEPEGGHIRISAEGRRTFVDAIQNEDRRFVSDAERTNWNSKETVGGAIAKAVGAIRESKNYTDGKVTELASIVDNKANSSTVLKLLCAGTKNTANRPFDKLVGCYVTTAGGGTPVKIMHNYGSTNYVVFATSPNSGTRAVSVDEKTANSFTLRVYDYIQNASAGDGCIDFVAYKL